MGWFCSKTFFTLIALAE